MISNQEDKYIKDCRGDFMSRDKIKNIIDFIPEKDIETIYNVLIHFIPEDDPLPDEIEEAKKDTSPTVSFDSIN